MSATPEEIEAAINGITPEGTENNAESTELPPAEEGATPDPAPEAEADEPAAEDPPVGDDWQEKFKKLQSAKDRELSQMQRELQELREAQAREAGRREALQEHEQTLQQQQFNQVTPQDLKEGIEQNLPATFQWTVQHRPDLVPQLISMVRETEGYGNATADQMVVEYTEYREAQREASIEAKIQAMREESEAKEAPLRQREAMESVVADLTDRFGDNFTAAQDKIAEIMQTDGAEYIAYMQSQDPGFEVTPEVVRDMMVDTYIMLREESLNQAASEPDRATAVPAAAQPLGGGAQSIEDPNSDEEVINSFIRGARAADMSIDPSLLP